MSSSVPDSSRYILGDRISARSERLARREKLRRLREAEDLAKLLLTEEGGETPPWDKYPEESAERVDEVYATAARILEAQSQGQPPVPSPPNPQPEASSADLDTLAATVRLLDQAYELRIQAYLGPGGDRSWTQHLGGSRSRMIAMLQTVHREMERRERTAAAPANKSTPTSAPQAGRAEPGQRTEPRRTSVLGTAKLAKAAGVRPRATPLPASGRGSPEETPPARDAREPVSAPRVPRLPRRSNRR